MLLLSFLGSGFLFAQIKVSAQFEGGNIQDFKIKDTSRIKLSDKDSIIILSAQILSRPDPRNPIDTSLSPSARWYYFKLTGVKGKQMFIKVPNSEVIRPFYSYDNKVFQRLEKSENVIKGTINKVFTKDTVYFSHFIPYLYSRIVEKVSQWSQHPDVKKEVIGKSSQGRDIFMLTITSNNNNKEPKKVIWIHGRSHPSESPASWHLEGMIEQLLNNSEYSKALRENCIFYIVPFINPDGVYGGYSRSIANGVNIEINWDRPDSLTMPEVKVLKKTIENVLSKNNIDVFLNMHSQIANSVTYWIHDAKSTTPDFFRKQVLFSNLTINGNPYYKSEHQSFSAIAPRYAEGWIWNKVGEKSMALTFETPYTYYNENPTGEWVSIENLYELAKHSLYAISDYLLLNAHERVVVDNPIVSKQKLSLNNDSKIMFIGDNYIQSSKDNAKITYQTPVLKQGKYEIYKWIAGECKEVSKNGENIWQKCDEINIRRDKKVKYRIKLENSGDKADALLFVRKSN